MEMNLQFSIDDLVKPPVSPSYFSSGEEMDVDIQSVETTASTSDDSDIEVIACYRQLPVQTQQTVGGRQMTTDLSGCSDNAFPDFPKRYNRLHHEFDVFFSIDKLDNMSAYKSFAGEFSSNSFVP